MLRHIKRYLITYIIVQFVMNMVHPGIIFATTDGTPLVNIDSPSLQGKTVTVSGTVEGAPQNAELIIRGDNFTSGTIAVDYDTGNWSYQFSDEFSSGEYHYTILATVDSQSTPSTTNLDFTVDATGPNIGINSSKFQNNNVIITGTVIDNTPSNVITMEIYDNSNPSNPTKINNVDIINPTPTNNQWTFSFPTEFVEGPYYYKIRATDSLGNFSEKNYTFYVGELPKVSSVKVNYADIDPITGDRITPTIELLNSEYMNHVTTNTKVTVSVTDNMITTDTIRNSIVVLNSEGGKVDGVISPPQKIGNEIQVEFSPTTLLQASTTYYILINPLLIEQDPQNPNWTTDSSGNPLLPVIKKFTTERESDVSKISADKQALHHMSDPHGDNGMNTNTCGNCHSTHAANLREISDEPTTQGKKLEQPNFNYSSYNYCMACHDGTVAPAPENMHQNGHYPEYGSTSQDNEKYSAGDCASCHNPHLTWSKENPNRLKDHFVHLHNDSSKQNNVNYPYGNNQEDAIDSLVQPCETCHDSDAQKVKDQYVYKHKDATIQNNPNYPTIQNEVNSLVEACEGCHEHKNVSELVRLVKEHDSINKDNLIAVNYKIIQYGSSSATGVTDDYGLCFRCHDGNKKWPDKNNVEHTISNIKQYYDVNEDIDPTKGSQSMHRITAIDGSSKLLKSAGTTANDGHIPCAVCHDTHGSSNIILLKNILGYEDRQSFVVLETDKNSFGVLNDTKERQFCLSCHNGSTAIYGVTGRELDTNLSDGHRDTDTRACSACHGLGTTPKDKALSAAHAPTSGKP